MTATKIIKIGPWKATLPATIPSLRQYFSERGISVTFRKYPHELPKGIAKAVYVKLASAKGTRYRITLKKKCPFSESVWWDMVSAFRSLDGVTETKGT